MDVERPWRENIDTYYLYKDLTDRVYLPPKRPLNFNLPLHPGSDWIPEDQRQRSSLTPLFGDLDSYINSWERIYWAMWGSDKYFVPHPKRISREFQHAWYFLVADKAQCDAVLDEGPLWRWEDPEECGWLISVSRSYERRIEWETDPQGLGLKGDTNILWTWEHGMGLLHEFWVRDPD